MENVSKAKIKLISQLRQAKHRRAEGLMTVEGTKSVLDTLPHFSLRMLIATPAWHEAHPLPQSIAPALLSATHAQLRQMSSLATAPDVIAVYALPQPSLPSPAELRGQLTLLLDGIQDPGNLGTIVRCADWFGVRHIIASPNTVDIYNPKTIQSTMGALSRVQVSYAQLPEVVRSCPDIPVCGTLLEGSDIYNAQLPSEAFIVMGNEGNGLSPEMRALLTCGLRIPSWPPEADTVESLNVAMATAIVLAEFRRPGR